MIGLQLGGLLAGVAREPAAAEGLLHFAGEVEVSGLGVCLDLERVVDLGEIVLRELSVEGGADDLRDDAVGGHAETLEGVC